MPARIILCMAQVLAQEAGQLLTTGERLRLARERSGMSVGEFAARIHMHRNNVPRWESRFSDPGLPVLRMYASTLGNTTVEWLAFELGDWPPLTPPRTRAARTAGWDHVWPDAA